MKNLRWATEKDKSCGDCAFMSFKFKDKVYLGKYHCNGRCTREEDIEHYIANNMVCDEFQSSNSCGN